MNDSKKYTEKIVEVVYYNFPLVHPKETVLKCVNALIDEYAKRVWDEACKQQMNEVFEHCKYSPQGTNGAAINHWVKLVDYKQFLNTEA